MPTVHCPRPLWLQPVEPELTLTPPSLQLLSGSPAISQHHSERGCHLPRVTQQAHEPAGGFLVGGRESASSQAHLSHWLSPPHGAPPPREAPSGAARLASPGGFQPVLGSNPLDLFEPIPSSVKRGCHTTQLGKSPCPPLQRVLDGDAESARDHWWMGKARSMDRRRNCTLKWAAGRPGCPGASSLLAGQGTRNLPGPRGHGAPPSVSLEGTWDWVWS